MPTHYGGTKLDTTIDGTELGDPQEAAKYEYDVVDQLRRVLDVYGNGAYKTGRWLMEELTKKLIIRPSLAHKSDASGNPVVDPQSHPGVITDLNASAESTNSNAAVAPWRIFGVFGLGSDVVIHYSPSVWWYLDSRRIGIDVKKHRYVQLAPDERFFLGSDKLASQPDDILFHEMFHAYRQMNGLWIDPTSDSFDNDYGKKEEFFSVVVTNIYVSERNTTYQPRALRGKYEFKKDGTEPAFRDLENDPQFQDHFSTERFYAKYQDALGQVINDMKVRFRNRLASVKAQFNPIALYMERHPNASILYT
jgi:hypothetical protein